MSGRVGNDPLRRAEKVRARLLQLIEKGPQLVYFSTEGRLECCTPNAHWNRLLERHPTFNDRVVGVFDHRASVALLADSIRQVRP